MRPLHLVMVWTVIVAAFAYTVGWVSSAARCAPYREPATGPVMTAADGRALWLCERKP